VVGGGTGGGFPARTEVLSSLICDGGAAGGGVVGGVASRTLADWDVFAVESLARNESTLLLLFLEGM